MSKKSTPLNKGFSSILFSDIDFNLINEHNNENLLYSANNESTILLNCLTQDLVNDLNFLSPLERSPIKRSSNQEDDFTSNNSTIENDLDLFQFSLDNQPMKYSNIIHQNLIADKANKEINYVPKENNKLKKKKII